MADEFDRKTEEVTIAQAALAQLGAPSPTDDDTPEFIRGYLAAADDLAEPYPASVPFFAPLTKEQIEQAVEAMGGDISGRLHAHWARHWAGILRKRSAELEPAPVEGSWDWALAQMKAGKRVTHPSSGSPWYIFINKHDQVLILAAGFEHAWVFFGSEFERTDWRIADGEKA